MTDDEFPELMRRADPARATPQTVTEADFQTHFAQVRRKARLARRRRRTWAAVPVAAVTLAALLIVQPWGAGTLPAYAATPPMLGVTPLDVEVQYVVTQSLDRLAALPDDLPQRGAETEGWYLELDEQGGVLSRPVVAPQETLIQWRDDLSGRITVTAGEPYLPEGGSPAAAQEDAAVPEPGTVPSDDVFGPGEMPVLFTGVPPSSVAEMRSYLETGGAAQEEETASYLEAVRMLASEWTLGAPQQAALLQVLASLDGMSVVGETTDRLGRPAIALGFSERDGPAFEYLLLLGADSGRLLALERVYLGGLENLELPTPAVVSYVVLP